MPVFTARSHFSASAPALFTYHERPGALERLLPPWQKVGVEEPGGIHDGERVVLRLGRGPVRLRWVAEHRDFEAGRSFRDVQIEGPFARWEHVHRCLAADGGGSVLEDSIDYALPGGAVGAALGGGRARAALERMFRFRHERIRLDLDRQGAFPEGGPLRIAVTGATGLVGSALVAFLRNAGHRVDRVTRRPEAGTTDIGWNIREGALDAKALEGVDAVVHLAGENLFGLRWSDAKKRAIRASRVDGTRLLARTLARLARPPRALVSASAIGLYGDRGDEPVDETAAPGEGFLAEVCRDWEAATDAASGAGVRTVHLRIGLVLAAGGGALGSLRPVFAAGLGGRVGDGTQGFSWIGLDDLVYAIHFLLRRDDVSGPVNATAPEAVSNAEFARTLGHVMRRPAVLPVPAAALRTLLGEMAEETLLAGAYVRPARLLEAGFEFAHRDLESALRLQLGRLCGGETTLVHER